MLHNLPPKLDKLVTLSESKHDFYLTGSYYFGGTHRGSDFDFFAENIPEIREWLEFNGFQEMVGMHSSYMDMNTSSVYRHRQANIDVQLVHDLQMKQVAQDMIKQAGSMSVMATKTQKKSVWELVYGCLAGAFGAKVK